MKPKIIVMTSRYLHEYIKDIIRDLTPDCNVQVIRYANFSHAAEIYTENEATTDGFLISGRAALVSLEKAIPNRKKPILSFQADLTSLYRLILEIFLEQRTLDPRRVILDFLLPFSNDPTIDYFLHGKDLDQVVSQIDNWIVDADNKSISNFEWSIVDKAISLRESHAVDLVISHYGSIIPHLEEKGIPCEYVTPSKDLFASVLENLLAQIELESIRSNFPAVIVFAPSDASAPSTVSDTLSRAVSLLQKDFPVYTIMHTEENRCYLYTTRKALYHVTNELHNCYFSDKLKNDFQLATAIGYGTGNNIIDAKKNADEALKESLFARGSFAIDENHDIFGPLSSTQYLEVHKQLPDKLSNIAQRCNLSPLTIQKLFSVVRLTGSTKFTTHTLAEHLGVTVRNANRIIQNLEKGGAISFAYTQSSATKGRPVKVYELKINEDSLS